MASRKSDKATVLDFEALVAQNDEYRNVIWTGKFLQMTNMTIKRGKSIGLEVHHDTDQMLYVQQGAGLVSFRSAKNGNATEYVVQAGHAILVPAGTWHDVLNTGRSRLKLVSLYAPPHHPPA